MKKKDAEAGYMNRYLSGTNGRFSNNHIVQVATCLNLQRTRQAFYLAQYLEYINTLQEIYLYETGNSAAGVVAMAGTILAYVTLIKKFPSLKK